MKKVYNAPYLKVVDVKSDILTTSAGFGDGFTNQAMVGERQDFFEDDEF